MGFNPLFTYILVAFIGAWAFCGLGTCDGGLFGYGSVEIIFGFD